MRLLQSREQGPKGFNSLKMGKVISGQPISTETHALSRPPKTELWKTCFIYIHVQTHRYIVFLGSHDN